MQHASGFERLAIVSCGKNNSRCSTVSYRKLHLLLRKSHLQKTCTTKAKGHSDSEKMILCIIFSREVIPVECYHADRKESNPEGQKREREEEKMVGLSFMTAYSENRTGRNTKDNSCSELICGNSIEENEKQKPEANDLFPSVCSLGNAPL